MVIACGLEKPDILAVLRQSGVRVVDVQPKGSMAGFPEVFDAIRAIGEATGRDGGGRGAGGPHGGPVASRRGARGGD